MLSSFGIIFESLVTKFLTSQHDFMKARSTCTYILEFINLSIGKIEEGDQVDVIYTDIGKAFDRLLHSVLVRNL